jgi:putative peptidoglycan lipid II flippase
VISVVVNIVLSLLLSRVMGHVGIALATSIAAWLNALQLGVTLGRREYFAPDDRLLQRLPRIIVSGLAMGALLLVGTWVLSANYAAGAGFMAHLWGLVVLVAGGAASYFALAHATGAMALPELRSMLKR